MNKIVVWALVVPLASMLHAGNPGKDVESLHEDIWKRFVYTNGLVLDYNLREGMVAMPTQEDCFQGKPNAVSWWTPVENGAFFTGLYLDAASNRWLDTREAEDGKQAGKLAQGLLSCAQVGETPGFVARFVLGDGKSHYGLGSDDQTGPWFYGLWKYLHSGAPSAGEREQIKSVMLKTAQVLKEKRWMLPCDPVGDLEPGQYRGGFGGREYRECVRLLFVLRMMHELTGDGAWKEEYERALAEKPPGSEETRLEVIRQGMAEAMRRHPGLAVRQTWIFVVDQGMLRELFDWETEKNIKGVYREAMASNAAHVASLVVESPMPGWEKVPYKTDWESMTAMWKVQKISDEATALALDQLRAWENAGRNTEIEALREPFCAAWIVFLSPDQNDVWKSAAGKFEKLMGAVHWPDLYSSYGIFAEGAWYQLKSSEAASRQ